MAARQQTMGAVFEENRRLYIELEYVRLQATAWGAGGVLGEELLWDTVELRASGHYLRVRVSVRTALKVKL